MFLAGLGAEKRKMWLKVSCFLTFRLKIRVRISENLFPYWGKNLEIASVTDKCCVENNINESQFSESKLNLTNFQNFSNFQNFKINRIIKNFINFTKLFKFSKSLRSFRLLKFSKPFKFSKSLNIFSNFFWIFQNFQTQRVRNSKFQLFKFSKSFKFYEIL